MERDVDIIRSFSRTYTQHLGLLNGNILNSPLSLLESRIVYELHLGEALTAKQLGQCLQVDKGYLSRVLKKLIQDNFVDSKPALHDQRTKMLSLTRKGRKLFTRINAASDAQINAILSSLNPFAQMRFVASLGQANQILTQQSGNISIGDILIRNELTAGDTGFVIQSQGELYQQEYNYSILFEKYVAEGMLEFTQRPKPNKNRVWVCEHNGYKMGFLLLLDRGNSIAQLRYFFVYPEYRGIGLGDHLMQLFTKYLRQSGFHQCYLWTTYELSAAARLYKRYGFVLSEEKSSRVFGKNLVEQKYVLDCLGE